MKRIRYIVLIGLILLSLAEGMAQHFPVQATFYSKPPYPIILSDYASPVGQNLSLKVLLRDLNLGPTQIYFRFRISSNQMTIGNPPFRGNVPLFTLTPGVVQTFTQADFSRYFERTNLGMSPFSYAIPLMEGIYTFSVEVMDALTNKLLSKSEQLPPVWLIVNDPPLLTLPGNLSTQKLQNPQNLLFQWMPRHRQANTVEYEFTLTELLMPANFQGNPQNLFLSQPPYYRAKTLNTTLLYGPTLPPLIPGRTYGFRVRAKAKQGFEDIGIFRNDGYSEIFIFQYGEKNRAPRIISAKWDNDGKALITWSGVAQHVRFDFQHKPTYPLSKNASNSSKTSSVIYEVQNPNLVKAGPNTYATKMTLNNNIGVVHQFQVGGISSNPTDELFYSEPVFLEGIDWSKITINGITKDDEDYLVVLVGKSRKSNPTPLIGTCQNPKVNPTDTKNNPIALGDILHAGGNDVEVVSPEYAKATIKTANGGSSSIKLYFSENFKINQYNEVISGYLTSEITNQSIKLISADDPESTSDINSRPLKALGIKTDSLKVLANQIHIECTEALKAGIGNVPNVKGQVVRLVDLLQEKQTAIKESLKVIDLEISRESNQQNKQKLQTLKTMLNTKLPENQKNINNAKTFIEYYFGFNTYDLFTIFPRLFL